MRSRGSVILGLIGGIGSGKSTVARALERFGALVVDADAIGHQVLEELEVKTAIVSRWGGAILDGEGRMDRRKLAEIVFQKTEQSICDLEYLKSLTHPRIGTEIQRHIEEGVAAGVPVIVLDIPLLLEAKWDHSVDRILFVDADRSVRLQRVMQRGWTEAEFNARESAQIAVEKKRIQAHDVVKNEGSYNELLDKVGKLWHNLVEDDVA